MSVQDHIENILNAEGQGALDAWYVAINEHPQNAMEIHDVVVDHLVENTFMYQEVPSRAPNKKLDLQHNSAII